MNTNLSLTPEQATNLTNQVDSPETSPQGTILTFKAKSVADDRDLVITIHPNGLTYTAEPRPGCICHTFRSPLECQCRPLECPTCNQTLTALEWTCTFQHCLHDNCPLCSHSRETCNSHEIIREINQQAMWQHAEHDGATSLAEAYVQAIADRLGEGTDAPCFPVTRRALKASPMLHPGKPTENGPWCFKDDSTLLESEDGL